MHVYCWDLDRTYLDTDIHSVRGLVRAALESASDKRNIPGSATLLRALLQHDPLARAAIVSGSPEQMRTVLSAKLTLDGVQFETMVLKDNLRNIRKGRLRAIRGQLGYKLPQLLALRAARASDTREILFGDDSEADALIYCMYRELVAGRMAEPEMIELLRRGGAYDDQVDLACRSLAAVVKAEAVDAVFIHADRRLPLQHYDRLGGEVLVVFSWFQAALSLWSAGRLGLAGVEAVADRCAVRGEFDGTGMTALIQDAVRRRLIAREPLLSLLEASVTLAPLLQPTLRALEWLGDYQRASGSTPDWHAFLALLRH